MFLKSLDIFGFKSFADKTHIDFSDGITSLLGPNGCGKSNIVDSIKWVLGEQSTKTLRASKMEDVIFNGNDKRKPMQFAEVTLTIDNSEHHLPTDVPEVEIKRRIFRTGESEYYLNRNRCLLRNVRELFFDTGVGKSAYSILEQGKIDQILSSKPEDRRYIFEEAAGISRFKMECNDAQRKIERTDENIAQVENIIKVEKRSYDSLKGQAEKARTYNELQKKLFDLDVTVYLLKLHALIGANDMRKDRITSIGKESDAVKEMLSTCTTDIEEEQGKLREKASASQAIQFAINRTEEGINGKKDRVILLEDRFHDYLQSQKDAELRAQGFRDSIAKDNAQLDELASSVEEKEDNLETCRRQIARAEKMIHDDTERIKSANDDVIRHENGIEELQQKLQEYSETLKKVIEDLVVELDEKMGEEYSAAKRQGYANEFDTEYTQLERRLGQRLAFYQSVPESAHGLKSEAFHDIEVIISSLAELKESFLSYCHAVPPFIDSLLAPEGLLTQKRKIEEAEKDAHNAIDVHRQAITACREMAMQLQNEVDGLRQTAEAMKVQEASLSQALEGVRTIARNLQSSIDEKELNLSDAIASVEMASQKMQETQDLLRQADEEAKELKEKLADLKEQLTNITDELAQQNSQMSERVKQKNDALDRLNSLSRELDQQKLWLSSGEQQVQELYTRFFNTYARTLQEFASRLEGELPEQVLIENELAEVQKQIATLGPNINHMAEDDFKVAKEHYDFYIKQMDDLEKAKADLVSVLEEIEGKSEELFLATYKQISENFQAMFRRLFGGGRAEISLQNPDDVLGSGIDIFAQPPGKKLITLSLLSGGERSMTAVALLFATYMVKPSPFCILDEIDAALDDKNIGYFLSVLEDFSKSSQFIIITHNKHTVMGSQALLGVTQMEAGVSTTVTYKLAHIAGESVILNENDAKVDFDASGHLK